MIVRGNRSLRVLFAALVVVSVCVLGVGRDVAAAPASAVTVHSANIESEFPTGFRVRLTADSPNQIESLAIRIRVGRQTRTGYDYLEFAQQGQSIDASFLWRTNTAANYIPPGTVIAYRFEFVDVDGARLETDYATFTYHDPRFTWHEVSEGPVTVAYHGRAESRAMDILRTSVDTLNRLAPLLGADDSEPVRVTVYNSWDEMSHAIPPSNSSVGRQVIIEGQAFTNIGTLLVLGTRSAIGTASHEMAHIVVHRAGEGTARKVPPWLHEGLAEYGNVDPGTSYDAALQRAVRQDRLLPITRMGTIPGRAGDVILFYGQSKALVRMMLDDFGPEKMREFMATYKGGASIDHALEQTYGLDRDGIENRLRRALGTSLLPSSVHSSRLPTPLPAPTVLPYTLRPDANGRFVGASEDMRAAESATDTQSPPTSQSVAPRQPDTPVPQSAAPRRPNTPVPLVYVAAPTSDDPPSQHADAEQAAASSDPAASTGCMAARSGAPIDLAAAGAIVGLAVLGVGARRRLRP